MKSAVVLMFLLAGLQTRAHAQAHRAADKSVSQHLAQRQVNRILVGAIHGSKPDRDLLKDKILPTIENAEDREDYIHGLNNLALISGYDFSLDGGALNVFRGNQWVAALSIITYDPLTISNSGKITVINAKGSLRSQLAAGPSARRLIFPLLGIAFDSARAEDDTTAIDLIRKIYFQNGRYLVQTDHVAEFIKDIVDGDLIHESGKVASGSSIKTRYQKFEATCSGDSFRGSLSFSADYLKGNASDIDKANKVRDFFSADLFAGKIKFESVNDVTTISNKDGQSLTLKLRQKPLSENMDCTKLDGRPVKPALCFQRSGEDAARGLWYSGCEKPTDATQSMELFCGQLPLLVKLTEEGKKLCDGTSTAPSDLRTRCNKFVSRAKNIFVSSVANLELCVGAVCKPQQLNELSTEVAQRLFPEQYKKKPSIAIAATVKALDFAKSMSALKDCCGDQECRRYVKDTSSKKMTLTPEAPAIK